MASENVKFLAHGTWRDVWMIKELDGSKRVVKTIRYEHDWEDRNYDRHRRDALASEVLTASPYVVNIYGHCGNSGIYEYAPHGDISDYIDGSELTKLVKLRIASQVAHGIADAHNVVKDDGGDIERAQMAHTDIQEGQFVLIDGVFKLNDFNRCRFLRRNRKTNEVCGYEVGHNPGTFRSPEEYRYDVQTEKVDIYSMGNIFYLLLTGKYPFYNMKPTSDKKLKKMIAKGEKPYIPSDLKHSHDPADVALIKAMEMCHILDPVKRAGAREVATLLDKALETIKS
eukprot:CAMPEP_0195511144 /NCGR_PEP_ID=MMETSP0794_2-20130614/3576_1 /TAXON_ID=515487 /ORGANISM="Stephanopyxis turris, Strain CCMP 815" /LENGTH=283 /DNA_ID=CAMNT_0040638693 /DNA_START=704 /DNA_END=1555 /DNA_ORIENTATION=-